MIHLDAKVSDEYKVFAKKKKDEYKGLVKIIVAACVY